MGDALRGSCFAAYRARVHRVPEAVGYEAGEHLVSEVSAGSSGREIHSVAVLLRGMSGHRVFFGLHQGTKDEAMEVIVRDAKREFPAHEVVYWLTSTVKVAPNYGERILLTMLGAGVFSMLLWHLFG